MKKQNTAAAIVDNSQVVAQDVRLHTMVFLIFSYCCGGCFGIEEMIPVSGPGLALLLIVLLPVFWAAPQALVASELGSALPYTGGFYKWIQRGLGEFWSFQAGWCRTIGQYVGIAAYVVLGVEYLGLVVPMTETQSYLVKAAVVILFTILNLRGIKEVGLATTILSGFVLIAFAFVVVVGFMHWNQNPFVPFFNESDGFLTSLTGSLAIGMWMYSGFTSISTLAGDCKDKSVIWKGLLIAIPLIMLMYLLPTMAGLSSVGNWQNWGSEVNYATVAGLAGPVFVSVFSIVAFAANISTYNTAMISLSRGFYAIAEDRLAPKVLAKVSKKKGIPVVSILVIAVFTLVACRFDFGALVTLNVTFVLVDYVLIWIAGIVLRVKEPNLKRPFRLPVNTVGFVFIVAPGMFIAVFSLLINGADYFFGGMIGLGLMPFLYVLIKWISGGLNRIMPQRHPINPRTKLAYGDLERIMKLMGVFTVLGAIAYFFIPVYEGAWGPAYYAQEYGFSGAYEFIIQGIGIVSLLFGVITILAAILNKILDPKEKRPEDLKNSLDD